MKRLSPILMAAVAISMLPLNTMAIEEAKYGIVRQSDNFEIRDYAPSIVAETIVTGDLKEAGNNAFRRLFGYISGDNRSRDKVEMTTPVSQQARGEKIEMTAPVAQQRSDKNWTVSFMMPSTYTMDKLPTPDDPEIYLREIPSRRMAAIRYSGTWSEKRYENHKSVLENWITINGLTKVGDPIWARYNSPLTPWFLRRNEILIPIAKETG